VRRTGRVSRTSGRRAPSPRRVTVLSRSRST
jgi:hypothetical protein